MLLPWLVRGALELHLIRPESEMAVFAGIQTVALVLLGFVFRRYLSRFIADPGSRVGGTLTVYAVLPFNYFNLPASSRIPTSPSVLLFTAGLLLISSGDGGGSFPLFVIATLNRETSIFLAVVSLFVLFDQLPRRTLAGIVGAQLAIWLAIKAALWVVYQQNRWMGCGPVPAQGERRDAVELSHQGRDRAGDVGMPEAGGRDLGTGAFTTCPEVHPLDHTGVHRRDDVRRVRDRAADLRGGPADRAGGVLVVVFLDLVEGLDQAARRYRAPRRRARPAGSRSS